MQKQPEDMKNIWLIILNQIREQGLSFLLLAGAVWVGWGQLETLTAKAESCNNRVIEIYQQQNDRLINTIERNSEAMENISIYIKASSNDNKR